MAKRPRQAAAGTRPSIFLRGKGWDDNSQADADHIERNYGRKIAGLLKLPIAWVPNFAGIPVWFFDDWKQDAGRFRRRTLFASKHRVHEIVNRLSGNRTRSIILRSSAPGETLAQSGRYKSIILGANFSWDAFERAVLEIYRDFRKQDRTRSSIGIIIQDYELPMLAGHLSNESHLSPTRNQWKYEIEQPSAPPRGLNSKFSSSPNTRKEVACLSPAHIDKSLRQIGHWINQNFAPRTHVEWCMCDGNVRLVQLDFESDEADGVDPRIMPPVRVPTPNQIDVSKLRVFEPYIADKPTKWRKLSNVNDFRTGNTAPRHRLFFAEGSKIAPALKKAAARTALASEIAHLTNARAVIRTDSISTSLPATNLPRTHTISGKRAVRWLRNTLADLRSRGVAERDLCFILHAYIPARACAWSYFSQNGSIVEIDALWGLPDGLQFLPHDSFHIDVKQSKIVSEKVRYKPHFLQEQEDGSWQYVQIRRKLARHRSISREAALELARQTVLISEKIKADAQIMWFCDIPPEIGVGQHLPWYRSREYAAPNLERRPAFRTLQVSNVADLDKLRAAQAGNHIISISPDAELIRNDRFLEKLIAIAQQKRMPVEIAGSVLGHAYYKLRNSGLNVYTAEPHAAYFRTRGRKVFHKLVRDQIPESIAAKGEQVVEAKLRAQHVLPGLTSKLFEEALELARAQTPREAIEELADIYEVFRAMISAVGAEMPDVVSAADAKRDRRGGFAKLRVLLETSLPKSAVDVGRSMREIEIPLEELGNVTVGDGKAHIPFTHLLSTSASAPVQVAVGERIVRIFAQFESGGIKLSIKDADAEPPSDPAQMDLFRTKE